MVGGIAPTATPSTQTTFPASFCRRPSTLTTWLPRVVCETNCHTKSNSGTGRNCSWNEFLKWQDNLLLIWQDLRGYHLTVFTLVVKAQHFSVEVFQIASIASKVNTLVHQLICQSHNGQPQHFIVRQRQVDFGDEGICQSRYLLVGLSANSLPDVNPW